ncbi:MAG: hypothetical protein HOV80_27425 [Polyangiaceae bacterium]|nr:hypothetical protein [Polyangiaceae bacterium]
MRIGTGKAVLRFRDGLPLFGYGPPGGRGLNVPKGSADHDQLQVRALYLESLPQKLLIVSYDLASGSRLVQAALLRALERRGHSFAEGQIWTVGTHTHAAPGSYLGNGYDFFGQVPSTAGLYVIRELVRKGIEAVERALEAPQPCTFSVDQRPLWGLARNRSLPAFLANFGGELPLWLEELGVAPPVDLTPEEQAIDPRLWVVTFRGEPSGAPLAVWASWCCHPATLPRAAERAYHRDWPGVALDEIERHVPFAMVHQGANGDVTSLPSGERRIAQPLDRVREIGLAVGKACTEIAASATARDSRFELAHASFSPAREGLPKPEWGAATMSGSEEFDPGWRVKAFGEGTRFPFRFGPQRPKMPAMGPLQMLLRSVPSLGPSVCHPLWLLRLGDHVFFASPFEQTTHAARRAENTLIAHWQELRNETVTASPLGLVGDYAGYVTTEAEFDLQHYEGAHTLYGSGQLDVLVRMWSAMIEQSGAEWPPAALDLPDLFGIGARVGRVLEEI